jgi:AcrR family transcriptional regulator
MSVRQPRERLLEAAVSHALSAGIADMSLRELAAAIGTSHRMLIYHFGSRDGLLVAVAQQVEAREREAFEQALEAAGTVPDAPGTWAHISDPSLWPQEKLFFELYARALRGRPGTQGFLDDVIDPWVVLLSGAFVAAGADEAGARADARLGVAVVRGLLLDLLATKDRQGVDAAYERYLQLYEHFLGWATPGGQHQRLGQRRLAPESRA